MLKGLIEIKLRETENFYETIDKLNKTHFDALLADRSVQQSEEISRYNDALNTLGSRVGMIEVPEEYIGRTEETNHIRNITFIEDRVDVDQVLSSLIESLEQLDKI